MANCTGLFVDAGEYYNLSAGYDTSEMTANKSIVRSRFICTSCGASVYLYIADSRESSHTWGSTGDYNRTEGGYSAVKVTKTLGTYDWRKICNKQITDPWDTIEALSDYVFINSASNGNGDTEVLNSLNIQKYLTAHGRPCTNPDYAPECTGNMYPCQTITFNNQGATFSGTVTAKAKYNQVLPTICPPSASYKVTLDPDNGDATSTHTVSKMFNGYFTAANGAGTQIYSNTGLAFNLSTYQSNPTFYAYWTGGTLGSLPSPEKEGYLFRGWYNGTQRYSATTVISANTSLQAKWKPVEYQICFRDNY